VSEERPTLAQRVRQLRQDASWSLSYLAGRSGVSRSYLNQIEGGTSIPSLTVLDALAAAFHMTTIELLLPLYRDEPQVSALTMRLLEQIETARDVLDAASDTAIAIERAERFGQLEDAST
jgi:transcriptional regulator with XRE-family HTH domain